ncbi:hypothetical protein HBB16_17785 [Pseudonocardia sp. MCCB 268]|nr:hypothetical protein [Pseudonocardia cytotoxica]
MDPERRGDRPRRARPAGRAGADRRRPDRPGGPRAGPGYSEGSVRARRGIALATALEALDSGCRRSCGKDAHAVIEKHTAALAEDLMVPVPGRGAAAYRDRGCLVPGSAAGSRPRWPGLPITVGRGRDVRAAR